MNCSLSSRQLKKYKFFLPVEIYLLAVFMQLASKFRVFSLVLKFRDSFVSVYCCSKTFTASSTPAIPDTMINSFNAFVYYILSNHIMEKMYRNQEKSL